MNNTIFFFFYNLSHQSFFLDKTIIFFADTLPYVVVILAGLFLLFHHETIMAENPFRVFWEKKREIIKVFGVSFLSYFISEILKLLFHTERPFIHLSEVSSLFTQSGYAFPSGHATFFSALAVSIFFMHKKAGYVFMVLALLIGLARIVAGVHFPVDILGGFALGALVAYLVRNV
ncbi:MAG: phosphatase PAP2 family protein [Minisyncoccia bacterium]